MATYRTGTITVTNGSKAVTGVSTLFKTAGVVSGDQLYIVDANNIPTGYLYEVDVVDSDTLITLKQNYQGATASGQSYMIMNMAGNQTVPNFASRLAPIMQSWSDVTENINTTPQINGIPQAGETGKIDKGWLPDATAEAKGVSELATSAEVLAGTDTERGITPATLTAKILGTVSAVDGVPTGAIIESGNNANGYYVKFANGTMIANAELSLTATNNNGGGTTGTLPATFSNNPTFCSTSGITSGGGKACRVLEGSTSQTTYTGKRLTVSNGGTVNGDGTAYAAFLFVGRWF